MIGKNIKWLIMTALILGLSCTSKTELENEICECVKFTVERAKSAMNDYESEPNSELTDSLQNRCNDISKNEVRTLISKLDSLKLIGVAKKDRHQIIADEMGCEHYLELGEIVDLMRSEEDQN